MNPAIAVKIQNPGDVVSASGPFRVQHSSAHYPETETYLYDGLSLPNCNMLDCHVTYTMIERISFEGDFGKKPEPIPD